MDNLLHHLINEKIYSIEGVVSHVSTPMVIAIDRPNFSLNIGNDFYFLLTKDLSKIPDLLQVKISGSANFFVLNPASYSDYLFFQYAFFRDYLEIDTTNAIATSKPNPTQGLPPILTYKPFTPYTLEFIKVTPMLSK